MDILRRVCENAYYRRPGRSSVMECRSERALAQPWRIRRINKSSVNCLLATWLVYWAKLMDSLCVRARKRNFHKNEREKNILNYTEAVNLT